MLENPSYSDVSPYRGSVGSTTAASRSQPSFWRTRRWIATALALANAQFDANVCYVAVYNGANGTGYLFFDRDRIDAGGYAADEAVGLKTLDLVDELDFAAIVGS